MAEAINSKTKEFIEILGYSFLPTFGDIEYTGMIFKGDNLVGYIKYGDVIMIDEETASMRTSEITDTHVIGYIEVPASNRFIEYNYLFKTNTHIFYEDGRIMELSGDEMTLLNSDNYKGKTININKELVK